MQPEQQLTDTDDTTQRQERLKDLERDAGVVREDIERVEAQVAVDREVLEQLHAEGVLDRNKIANLEKALVSARRIGAAIGILMHSERVTEDQAFARLMQASQTNHRKLRDVADDVVLTGTLPS